MNRLEERPSVLRKIVELYRSCPVCGSRQGASLGILEYAQFDHSKLVDCYEVVCCVDCGFVTVNTPLQQRDYDEFYKESFYSPEYLSRQLSEEEKKYFEQTVEILSAISPKKDVALFDIGCGVGCLIEALRDSGFSNVYGVDPSSSCVKLLNEQKKVRCERGSITLIPFHGLDMDMVILSHIIEHIVDLESALKSIIDRVSEKGKVFVEVPDAVRYDQFGKNKPLSFFYLQHIVHFDTTHLRNLFVTNGFKEVKSGCRTREENGFTMPCVWSVFQKDDASKRAFLPDFSLALKIKDWFENSSLDPSGALAHIAEQKTALYVWGIGIHAQLMLRMSPLRHCNIKALVDKNERLQGATLDGYEISSVDLLKDAGTDEAVLISALVHSESMLKYLKDDVGFNGEIITI